MNIKLTNGVELDAILVTGNSRYIHGANRDVLSFIFPATAGLETLDATFTPENCESITIVDNNTQNIYVGYTIRCELSKMSVGVAAATADAEAVYEDRIMISMAQRTYVETQIARLQATVTALSARVEA